MNRFEQCERCWYNVQEGATFPRCAYCVEARQFVHRDESPLIGGNRGLDDVMEISGRALYCLGLHYKQMVECSIHNMPPDHVRLCQVCRLRAECRWDWHLIRKELEAKTGISVDAHSFGTEEEFLTNHGRYSEAAEKIGHIDIEQS